MFIFVVNKVEKFFSTEKDRYIDKISWKKKEKTNATSSA